MLPEIGFIALLTAAAFSALQGFLPCVGYLTGRPEISSATRLLAGGAFVLYAAALTILAVSLAQDDFSVAYAAQHSNRVLPLLFKIAAAWGGHEGSMLFFVATLSLWGALVAFPSKGREPYIDIPVLAVLGGITLAFALFAIFTSDPFVRQFPPPVDGRDLNPMLQDIALVFHPPLLYIGYAGFAVSFAYAMVALLLRRVDSVLIRACRPWTLAAWIFLTAGIALGAWWAYFELGWGGWWFWDPVENASLMPWLLGTALLHVIIACEKRGIFGLFVLLLAFFTFSFSVLGTFIVRSGILSSVHAFAANPDGDNGRGLALLLILSLLLTVVLGLFALRADTRASREPLSLVSKESALAATGALFCVATACVLIGTFFPLFYNLAGWGAISVGAPYFNRVFVPLCLVMLAILAFAPVLRWQSVPVKGGWGHLLLMAMGAGAGAWLCLRHSLSPGGIALIASILAGCVAAAHLVALVRERGGWRTGIHLVHVGVACTVIGAVQLAQFTDERWLAMAKGEYHTLGGFTFILDGGDYALGPNYTAERLDIRVEEQGTPIARLMPERRFYEVREQAMTEPGVAPKLSGDFYASIGEKTGPNAYTVHLQYKPMASWLWLGAALMVFGGLLRFAYRRPASSLPGQGGR